MKNNDITAQLQLLGGVERPFQSRIKDISLAGMGFLRQRTETAVVSPGDRLVIAGIQQASAVDFLAQTTLKVEWVVDTDILKHIGFGCSFLNLDSATRKTLDDYIKAST